MTVYKHQGKWRYDFQKDGMRYRDSGFLTKQEAKDAETDERRKIGKINTDFIRLCESRLEELELRRTGHYFKENKTFIENLIRLWGTNREITRDDVELYLKSRAKGSLHAANKELRFIKALFNHGIEREWFSYNPAGKIKPFPAKKRKKHIPLKEDVIKVLSEAKPLDRLYLLVIIHTLGRISEINRLRWDDVHENHLILKTRKAKNSNYKERVIPLNKILKEALSQIPKNGEYVFINPTSGTPGKPETRTKYGSRSKFLKTLCKKSGVTEFTYHCLRHFGASVLADSGEGITNIQAILGHERATTTDIYLRTIGKGLQKATEKLEDIS
jgi:integrase